MASSISSTPHNFNNITNQNRHKKLVPRILVPPETPECVPANMETPKSKRRISKEDFNNLLTVAVRIRPMNNRELSCSSVYNAISVKNNNLCVKIVPKGNIGVSLSHNFEYDHIFWSVDPSESIYSSQESVFVAIGKPMLDNAFKGYNACLFAYGQTGSGKSYSMMGHNCDIDRDTAGIIPRFCYDLFQRLSELSANYSVTVDVSFFEIYNERIFDLLTTTTLDKKTPLKVREHPVWGPHVVNLSSHNVKSFSEVRNILQMGNKHRSTAATVANEKSSRSHSIFSIELSICDMDKNGADSGKRSKISLVDLAGSERVGNANTHDDRHREGVSINQSLLTLGKVISSLADAKKNHTFIPYRESILTWLLRESLGGNSLTSMLATITPASTHIDETLATLRYACQARSIVNRAFINESPNDRLIRQLRAEVARLRALKETGESQLSINQSIDNSANDQEIEEVRQKLLDKEQQLLEAQKIWNKRCLEMKQKQLEELAAVEKKKEELESYVRVMSNSNQTVHISPYKSTFLNELENILDINKENIDCDSLINEANKWSESNQINIVFKKDKYSKNIIVNHDDRKMFAVCDPKQIQSIYQNYPESMNNLNWQLENTNKRIMKNSICQQLHDLYTITTALGSSIEEDNDDLKAAYLQIKEAVINFDSVLNNCANQVQNNKKVKFGTVTRK